MARFSFSASCTSRTVDGPRVQRTRRISSSDAVGFCGGCFMREPYYEDVRSVNENLRRRSGFLPTLLRKWVEMDINGHFLASTAPRKFAVYTPIAYSVISHNR